jgi:hypothetical protein
MPICQLCRRSTRCPVEVGLIGRLPVEARMWPSAIIKAEIGADRSSSLGHRIVCSEIGEWREALQPRALPEPDVNLSIHPAPIIQP